MLISFKKCLTRLAIPAKDKNVQREAFLNVLINYIANGADIVDFFSQIDDVGETLSFNVTFSILSKFIH